MQFHRRYAMLALLWKLLSYAIGFEQQKKTSSFSQVRGMYSVFVVTQLQVCVWSMDTRAYTKLTFCLHYVRHTCSVFTALWCGCSVVKRTFYPISCQLWLVWTNLPVRLSSPHPCIDQSAQIMPRLHRIQSIMDVCQVREYPDSTISKVLTVLKWWIITKLNRKLLEKQYQCYCQFWKSFNPVYIQI